MHAEGLDRWRDGATSFLVSPRRLISLTSLTFKSTSVWGGAKYGRLAVVVGRSDRRIGWLSDWQRRRQWDCSRKRRSNYGEAHGIYVALAPVRKQPSIHHNIKLPPLCSAYISKHVTAMWSVFACIADDSGSWNRRCQSAQRLRCIF